MNIRRPNTTLADLASLKPVFNRDGSVTAVVRVLALPPDLTTERQC